MSTPEPSIDELNKLWTAAIECSDCIGASSQLLRDLYDARMKKHSWVGPKENQLRFALDSYLYANGYRVYGAE